ncbi:oxidoreductase [Clostridium botulinum A2B3 87]|uniref:Gfo/Idh/MocA family oxidoreductase n=1 Tax=Clostridium botulinum TaxID=1491 RepID=UPI0004A566DA|nr:Gfo/Idh/MocA family oxidoreductase [Clostridium botulinum]KEI98110.1 oxidoreductase [Clostridium botulinum F 357]KEI99836.1 oxidoreductase [Clostridium botulinum A2B3 87]MBE1302804.1 Gfo/Idh/MocA family oxidoreductase [Clostridium botulinum]MCJ8172747.1 Gfo/Idh/MocA family oxidoreductase [Clostridium botulinum]NFK78425.1 oxidoreductase [Clostridium botulinum]
MRKVINIGLIGYGSAGRIFHAPMIASLEGLNLYKVYETREENINALRKLFENALVTNNVDEILEDENIELVIIATPNSIHYTLAKKALEKGKNVVLEKPFTVNTKEADELIKLAKNKNKLLTVHHNRRWDSDFRTVKKVIENNLLGEIVEYEAHFDRFRNYLKENSWKEKNHAGSGILYDLGSHLIDQAQCLFGLPKEIFADLRIQRENSNIIDNFEVILNYDKLKVTLKAGMLVRKKGPHFIVLGTKGSFIKYGMDIQEENLKNGLIPKDFNDWGKEPETLWGKINTEVNELHMDGKIESELGDYRSFYKNVYLSILGEEELEVKPIQARNTIRIIELAQKSSEEKRWIKFTP